MKQPRPSLLANDWCRLNRLLEQALNLEPDERAAWLAALDGDATSLRPLLSELLASPSADAAAGVRVPTVVANVAADALAAMRRERPGDRVGPWQLQRLVAEGGMGAVWVAQRADGVMERTAALKLPRAEWADHGLTERIARERGILARLQHPNIAVLFDAGVGVDGRPYLALEFVDGTPIDAYCQGQELTATLRLFVLVVRAVAYAHAQLVIHRDLKPGNVLVTPHGIPKLLDFGISKLMDGDSQAADETALTRFAGRRLTLAYAAPEQVLGTPVTVAADVYALGVMLYELLAGKRPFRADDARALEAEILKGEPRPPSLAAADKTRARGLRGDLDAIVLTALRRDPAQRYQTAAAFADDIEHYLDGQPVAAQPDRRLYRLRKFVARNALPVAAGAAIVVALGVGLAAALWQAQRATALNEFVLSLIRQADPQASPQTRDADVAMLAAIEQKIDQQFSGSSGQLLQLRLTVGEAYLNRGEMSAARRVFQRAADAATAQVAADDLMLLTAQVRASDSNLIVSNAAATQLDRAIAVLERKRGAAAAELLIDALLIRHRYRHEYGVPAFTAAETRLEEIREIAAFARQRFGAGSRQHLRAIDAEVLWTWRVEGRAAARQAVEAALAAARTRNDRAASSAEYRSAEGELAALHCEDGMQRDESIATLRESIRAERAAHGPTSVRLEPLLSDLGRCLHATGVGAELGAIVEAYEIAAARERPPSTNLMRRAQFALLHALQARDFDAALGFYRSAMANAAAFPDEDLRDRQTRVIRSVYVCLLVGQGAVHDAEREAKPLIAEANELYARLGRLTPSQGFLWPCLVTAQRQQGRPADALQTLQTFTQRVSTMKFSAEVRRHGLLNTTSEQALIELDLGRSAAAQATLDRLPASPDMDGHSLYLLAHGRTLLANGRAGEAIEPLRRHHATWSTPQPASPYTAEALYWLGRANRAAGEARGATMLAEAKAALAHSPVPAHRRLATDPD